MRISTLLIVGYIAIVVLGFILVVSDFGFVALVLEIIGSACLGFWLLLRGDIGFSRLINTITSVNASDIFSGFLSTYMYYIGAILLILPGIFSDSIGVILLICSLIIQPKQAQNSHTQNNYTQNNHSAPKNSASTEDDEIIDVEIIQKEDKS
ncbi:FxsA family protein [uncultured Helicobacter sp.]|uniref:FxsA family protein n=1 Tax=uncultured Helicobacter sp. TaxID=175537 RepID=UPI002597EB1D|nr:FxsA family protein [uncultured Helicobacter sp.]